MTVTYMNCIHMFRFSKYTEVLYFIISAYFNDIFSYTVVIFIMVIINTVF